ncbi:MAG: trypsin-like peptidase domain-containing protein [Thermoguttaceae bacterium]|nr:trypsin-like peptidase domain-containing protein [Thermoguttaceae bacterium]
MSSLSILEFKSLRCLSLGLLAALLCLCSWGGAQEPQSRMVLLDFTQEQCPACQRVAPLLEELMRKNYPVRRVDPMNSSDQILYDRYGIETTPSYVMLLDGREVGRYIGRGEGMNELKPILLGMFDQAAAEMRRTGAAPQEDPVGIASVPAAAPAPQGSLAPAPPMMHCEGDVCTIQRDDQSAAAGTVSPQISGQLLGCSVRLRAGDQNTTDCGTGTIIHSNTRSGSNEGLILTCGHLFRENRGAGNVQVDLFDAQGQPAGTVNGVCVWYDDDLDIGFVGVPLPAAAQVAQLVAPGYLPKSGDTVLSVGCTSGENPTVWEHKIQSTDQKFHQSARPGSEPFYYIEVSNAPRQGRSGGGLFVQENDGTLHLVGVCNAGDPQTDQGYFLPSSVIYQQLLSNKNLAFVYEDILKSQSGGTQLAAAESALPGAPIAANGAAGGIVDVGAVSGAAGAVGVVGGVSPAGFESAPAGEHIQPVGGTLPGSDAFAASLEELRKMHQQGAEIICIVNWPNGRGPEESEVIRLSAPMP